MFKWRFPKMWIPQTMGLSLNTEMVQFWMIWGYRRFRKPQYLFRLSYDCRWRFRLEFEIIWDWQPR